MSCRQWHVLPLFVALALYLSGCTLLIPPKPPVTVACDQQDREIDRLKKTLAEKDTKIRQLHTEQTVQAKVLKQAAGEIAHAEIKLRRLATEAGAASQLAEAEVALHGMRARTNSRYAAAQLAQAQHILDAGAASFAEGDYGAAVELAAQSQEFINMAAGDGRRSALSARDSVEVVFQVPIVLNARIDSNLRARPSYKASVMEVLPRGTTVQAYAYRGAWLKVRTREGREGWVFSSLLQTPQPGTV